MSDLGTAVLQLGSLFTGIINIYVWVLVATALLSFVNPDPFNPIVQFLYRITNPAYSFVRRYTRTDFNGLDLAPLIVIIALQVLMILMTYLFTTIAKII